MSILYPKVFQRILLSHKVSEKYNEQELFYEKALLKSFAIFTGKQLSISLLFDKNAGLEVSNFIKIGLQYSCFLVNGCF